MWGTRMIASSSTFRPHLGKVTGICLQHGTEALAYSNHPREAAASTSLATIFGRIASAVLWFLH